MKKLLVISALFVIFAVIVNFCSRTSEKEISTYLNQIEEIKKRMIEIDTKSNIIFKNFSKKFPSEVTSDELWEIADRLDKEVYQLTNGLVDQLERIKPDDKNLKYYHDLYLKHAAELQSAGVLKAIMVGDASIMDKEYFESQGRNDMDEAYRMILQAGNDLRKFDRSINELKEN